MAFIGEQKANIISVGDLIHTIGGVARSPLEL
jgi:hypothetical protein